MTTPQGGGLRHDGDEDKFVVIPRPTIRDDRLSFRARGMLAYILDLPSGWDVKATWLEKQGKEGREAVYAALKELRATGYYRVERRRIAGGRWVSGTAVSKTPRPSWAAEYAEQEAARKAKRQVREPVVTVLEDGTVIEDIDADSDGITTVTDLRVPVGREPGDRIAADREPVVLTEDPQRSTDKEEHNSEGVSHVSTGAAEQPPLDHPDGTHRVCPVHRLRPAIGACPPCGTYRRAWEVRQAELDAAQATLRLAADDIERRQAREARELADAERDACGLCDAKGFATLVQPGKGEPRDEDGNVLPETVKCLHDDGSNRRGIIIRRQAKADLAARRPDAHGQRAG